MSLWSMMSEKMPKVLDFIIEIRGAIRDMMSLYDQRLKQKQLDEGTQDAQQTKDTSKLEDVFKKSGPQGSTPTTNTNTSVLNDKTGGT